MFILQHISLKIFSDIELTYERKYKKTLSYLSQLTGGVSWVTLLLNLWKDMPWVEFYPSRFHLEINTMVEIYQGSKT